MKIARSARSSRSQGYGWVLFRDASVAAIAAKTMDNYMLFGKKLVCRVLAPEAAGPTLFRNSHRKMLPSRRPKLHKAKVNAPIDDERHARQVKRQAAKRSRLEKELEALGIDYELPGAEKKKTKTEEVEKAADAPAAEKKAKKGTAEKKKVAPEKKTIEQKKEVVAVPEKKKKQQIAKAAPVTTKDNAKAPRVVEKKQKSKK